MSLEFGTPDTSGVRHPDADLHSLDLADADRLGIPAKAKASCQPRCPFLSIARGNCQPTKWCFPALCTVALTEPLHGMGGRLNLGDIEDGQCGGDSCRGGDCVHRSRSPGLGFVTDGGCAAALLRCSVGGVEVGGQDSTPIVSSGRSQDPAGHRANIGQSPDSCRGVVAIDAECGSAGIVTCRMRCCAAMVGWSGLNRTVRVVVRSAPQRSGARPMACLAGLEHRCPSGINSACPPGPRSR